MIHKLLVKTLMASFALTILMAFSIGAEAKTVVLEGTLSGKTKLKPKNTYLLRGGVFVSGKLIIKPGTTILGTEGSFLVISPGATIDAQGTLEKPIVFTSVNREGARSRGDWGGVVLEGRAPINVPGGTAVGEGNTGTYGGNNPTDNSGIMKFVRIEYGGFAISPDNELNGLAFQGVGNGTEIDFIESFAAGDDAFEWFGGTVNAKHLVGVAEDDDGLDWTFGWSGNVQFAVIQQRADISDNGIEADNNENGFDFLPRADPTMMNVTLVGAPEAGPGSKLGLVLRRGTAGKLINFIVLGFKGLGVEVRDASTFTQLDSGALSLRGFIFFNNGNGLTTPENFNGLTSDMLSIKGVKILQSDPQLKSAFSKTAPDFRPNAGSPALNPANVEAPPAGNSFFVATNYVGAFDATTDWTVGWTKFAFGM
jgi:hypothetical protein